MKFSLAILSLLGSLALCHADAVRLQINGPGGKPVANAKVRVVESKGLWFRRTALPARDFLSDATGQVALESKGSLDTKADAATISVLQARVLAPGLTIGGIRLKAGDNTLALASAPTTPLEGIALGDDQKPVASARLILISLGLSDDKTVSLPDELALEATTDARGHWQLEGMPGTGTAYIEVRDPRFKRESFRLDLSQKRRPSFSPPAPSSKAVC